MRSVLTALIAALVVLFAFPAFAVSNPGYAGHIPASLDQALIAAVDVDTPAAAFSGPPDFDTGAVDIGLSSFGRAPAVIGIGNSIPRVAGSVGRVSAYQGPKVARLPST